MPRSRIRTFPNNAVGGAAQHPANCEVPDFRCGCPCAWRNGRLCIHEAVVYSRPHTCSLCTSEHCECSCFGCYPPSDHEVTTTGCGAGNEDEAANEPKMSRMIPDELRPTKMFKAEGQRPIERVRESQSWDDGSRSRGDGSTDRSRGSGCRKLEVTDPFGSGTLGQTRGVQNDQEPWPLPWSDPHLGARRPLKLDTGWKVFQIKPGRSRAWMHPPSKNRSERGPDLSTYKTQECLGTVLEVEHTERFTSVRVRLSPVVCTWVNVWTSVNGRGQPRGINFCTVVPPQQRLDGATPGQKSDGGLACATKILPATFVAMQVASCKASASGSVAGESEEETWFAYFGFYLVYFGVLAAIYEVIKHCFRKACCRRPNSVKPTRNTGINTDRTEAEETEQTGQTSQTGQCIWISATRGMKFHTRHNCYHIAGRAKDSYEKCSDCGRAEREAEYGRQGPTMLRGRP